MAERLSSQSNKMKSLGLQKSQFLNYLVNWEKSGSANLGLYSKNLVFNLFLELEKIEKSSQSNIQKSKNLFLNWEKLQSIA